MTINNAIKDWLSKNYKVPRTITDDEVWKKETAKALVEGKLTEEKYLELTDEDTMPPSLDPNKLFARKGSDNIRVKAPSEQYDETRYAAKSAKTGLPVVDPLEGTEVMTQSEGSKARAGVLLKHLANRSGLVSCPLSEHERGLLDEMASEHAWSGKVGSDYIEKAPGRLIGAKALIDDATSGGLEIAPIEFDSDVISFPLLYGELFPLVDLKNVPRGRRIEGASVNTPTMSWGGVDGTSISLFDTQDLVSAIDTTIHVIEGAIEVGRDFLSDSPVEVGSLLTRLVGERLMNELDKVIAVGNGSTQPEGLFNKSGVSTVTADNAGTGPPTLDDYYDLLFGVAKQYRKQAFRPTFVSNDTSYRRSRGIKIDTATPSTDQRAALAPLMDASFFNNYSTLGWNHRIENNITNPVAGFFCMSKYRMYRRKGLEMRFVEGGKELARKNLVLLVYRARFGGQLMDANAAAKWTNGQN